MIYTVYNNRCLKYSTPLIEYIKSKYLYDNENLIYTKKYSNGTFSIMNPTSEFSNCRFINGYPHFDIPLEICLDEINFFLNNESMYNNNFYIRYGDTHPHKCIPKLAQIRNLLVENALSNMIGSRVKSYYGLGDISLKSLADFIFKNNINCSPEDLFIKIVNNNIPIEIYCKLEKYNYNALKEILLFLKQLKLSQKEFLIESKLYENQKLYNLIKKDPNYIDELKGNGELKYSLQELMFIMTLIRDKNDVLINIIGANQISHVLKVNELLKGKKDIDSRFLTYEICRNADDRDINSWSVKLNDFIEQNNLKFNNHYVNYQDLLKILMIINSNDVIIDFDKLEKYKNIIIRFNNIVDSIREKGDTYNIKRKNDLLCKMALVSYNLNRSVEMGNQNNFYKYLVGIVNEYENNKEQYYDIEGLYKSFVIKGFERLGYKEIEKVKELKK